MTQQNVAVCNKGNIMYFSTLYIVTSNIFQNIILSSFTQETLYLFNNINEIKLKIFLYVVV